VAVDIRSRFDQTLWDLHRQSFVPLMTVSETEHTIIIEVDLPLVRKEDIHLRLLKEGLEVEASLRRCIQFERWGTVQRSCEFSSFYRIIPIPSPVVNEGVKATLTKGILRVILHKRNVAEYPITIE
jgi:HSP20 family molecular chaperone IbpA